MLQLEEHRRRQEARIAHACKKKKAAAAGSPATKATATDAAERNGSACVMHIRALSAVAPVQLAP